MQIHLHTESNPEDNAMLQALYSRSAKSVTEHLERLNTVSSGNFMKQYYVGYGHASIGDTGFVTLYFEGISMLAAKAIEDSPLFNGQESSSRYIDFSSQHFVNPYRDSEDYKIAEKVLVACRQFYASNLEPVYKHLCEKFPNENVTQDVAQDTVYEKTIRAKTFDVLRGFLPAGATTNVAWTTSLRKAHDRLVLMMHHPLYEIRAMAGDAYILLYEAYPSSFKKDYYDVAVKGPSDALLEMEGNDVWADLSCWDQFYTEQSYTGVTEFTVSNASLSPLINTYSWNSVRDYSSSFLKYRPAKSAGHRHDPDSRIQIRIDMPLDFGSFRDIHRHRAGYCSNPILEIGGGFHPWYYFQLPESSKVQANALFKEISEAAKSIREPSPLPFQYILPMGAVVPVTLDYNLAQAIYVAELRSGKTVHPTLRFPMQKLSQFLMDRGIRLYADMDESDWTLRRGSQDIVSK